MDDKTFEILLVDDNPATVRLMKFGFEQIALPHHLKLASNGQVALDVLADRSYTPDIILLALGLPKVSGGEVYQAAKSDPRTRHIPIVILRSKYDARQARIEDPDYCTGRQGDLDEQLKIIEFIQSILLGAPMKTRDEAYISPRLLDSSSEPSE